MARTRTCAITAGLSGGAASVAAQSRKTGASRSAASVMEGMVHDGDIKPLAKAGGGGTDGA